MPKQDGEHGVAAAKQMKLNNSIEEQEMAETRKKAKEMPVTVPGKQAGKAKGRGRSVPSYNVAGESQTEGEAKTKGSGRVSEAVNGILHEQKASASLGSSQLAFDKDATVSSPQPGHDGHGSPDIDRPSFSDSIDILLDSPWSGNGSGDTAQDGGPGSRMLPPCVGCTMLKAELDTVREELQLTQGNSGGINKEGLFTMVTSITFLSFMCYLQEFVSCQYTCMSALPLVPFNICLLLNTVLTTTQYINHLDLSQNNCLATCH